MAINAETLNLDKDKLAALEVALGRIEKDHGRGAVMRGNEQVAHLITNVIPTGSLSLDLALGVGGLPRGRVTEIYGGESAGKSTLAIHIMTETQRMGGLAAYVDVEHALDPQYATNCGARPGQPAYLPTRLRGTGAGHHRAAGPERRHRRHHHRQRGCPGAPG